MGWEKNIDFTTAAQTLNDANSHPLTLGESVWLTVRSGNTLYRLRFIVVDRITVEVLTGTEFLNEHVIDILCTEQKIRFRNGEVPIVKQLTGVSETYLTPFLVRNWTKTAIREIEGQ